MLSIYILNTPIIQNSNGIYLSCMGCQKGQKAKRIFYLYIRAPIYISELLFVYRSSYLYIGAPICISELLFVYRSSYLYIGAPICISSSYLYIGAPICISLLLGYSHSMLVLKTKVKVSNIYSAPQKSIPRQFVQYHITHEGDKRYACTVQ